MFKNTRCLAVLLLVGSGFHSWLLLLKEQEKEREKEKEKEKEKEREREREKEKEKEKEKEQRRSARVGDKGGVDDVQVTDNSGVECPTCHKVFKNLKALGGHTKGQWESF